MSLKDKVIFISGGSRGIGLAMVKKAAEDGAKIAIAAKTAEPHPKLPGTIYTAAEEIVDAGGEACTLGAGANAGASGVGGRGEVGSTRCS